METCPLLSWCGCNSSGICGICKILVVAGVAALSGVLGFLIGRRKGK